MKSDQELFLRTPVRKAVMRMAIPTVISSLVLVIYNMADTFSILLGQVFGLKGINFTQTTADYLSIIIALFLLVRALRRQHPATDSEQG